MRMEKNYWNGATFNKILLSEVEGALTTGKDKFIIKSPLDISLMTGSTKYKDQLQIILFAKDVDKVSRSVNNSKFNRMEIFIPVEDISEIISALNIQLERTKKLEEAK